MVTSDTPEPLMRPAYPNMDTNTDKDALYIKLTILAVVLIALTYFITTFAQGKIRSRVFSGDFMK